MSILCQNAFTKSVFFTHGLDSPPPLGGRGESTIYYLPQDMGNLWSHCVGSVRAKKIGGFVALKNRPWQPARGPPCNGVNTKMLPIGCSVMKVKKLDHFRIKWIWGQKIEFPAQNSAKNSLHLWNHYFSAQTAWQAVSLPRLPKAALLSPKTLFFGLKSIFCGQPKKDCYNHDGTPQRQPFLLTALQGGLRVGVSIYLP